MTLSERERDAVVRLLQEVPWADFSTALEILERALERALDATYDDFLRWEEGIDERSVESEFEIDRDEMRNAPPEVRLAYVARLLRSATMFYGAAATTEQAAKTGLRHPPARRRPYSERSTT